jgi:ribosomal protein S4
MIKNLHQSHDNYWERFVKRCEGGRVQNVMLKAQIAETVQSATVPPHVDISGQRVNVCVMLLSLYLNIKKDLLSGNGVVRLGFVTQ